MSSNAVVVEVAPVIQAAAYADGDQLGSVLVVPHSFLQDQAMAKLTSISVVDGAKQNASIDFFFFDDNPTNAVADNSPASITDAEMLDKCVGVVNVPIASYANLDVNSVATVKDIGLIIRNRAVLAADKRKLYALMVIRTVVTYTATSNLRVRFGLEQF